VKCELVEAIGEDDDKILFEGTIDCDPEECQVIMHKGQAFVFNGTDDEVATYIQTAVAEFTEGKD
jgi:regulatory protein YycI of two-component signal transduction system YycFG